MRKAIGFTGCATLLAVTVSLWLAGGGKPSKTVSAQTDESPFAFESPDAEYEAVGRRLMTEARQRAAAGDAATARKLAERASTFPVSWGADEQTPSQFIQTLGNATPTPENVFAQPVIQAGPSATDEPVAQAEPAFGAEQPAATQEADVPALEDLVQRSDKEKALAYLVQAKQSMQKGDYEVARAKVLQAKQLNVSYTLFEERPEHILAEIERKSATVTIAGAKPAAPQESETQPAIAQADSLHSKAQALLKAARVDITAGRFDDARTKATEAGKLDVTYGLFDDRPELVLSDLDQISQQATIANNGTTTPTPTPNQDAKKQQATSMLAQAREALKNGDLVSAREIAKQASQIDVTYELFEDRPELVTAEIDRVVARQNLAKAAVEQPTQDANNAEDALKAETYAQAQQLLKEARAAVAAGDLDAATAKAKQAETLQASYRLFDDRPDLVMNDIDRVRSQAAIATAPEASADADPSMAAQELLKQARADVAAGRLTVAREKAEQAQKLSSEYSEFEDRPELVIAEINRILRNGEQAAPVAQANPFEPNAPTTEQEQNPFEPPQATAQAGGPAELPVATNTRPIPTTPQEAPHVEHTAVVHPSGASAIELYNQGLYHLRQNDRDAARDAFMKAYASGETLDLHRRQQLQNFLRELTPRDDIQLTNAQMPTEQRIGPETGNSEIDIVQQQQALQYDRLRTEVLNSVFRAERLKETNSDQALEVLDRVTTSVESANLSEEATKTLLRHIANAADSIRSYQEQRAPMVELERQNNETRDLIEQDRKAKIRVEQEFADLVEKYNELFDQRRYGEAEIVAKQAQELDPDNPVSVTMVWKSRFARRIARDDEIREQKEESWGPYDAGCRRRCYQPGC